MFIKETRNSNGKIYVRVMESVRCGDRVLQKTVLTVGSCWSQEELKFLREEADRKIIEFSNERKKVICGLEKYVYSKKPEYYKKPCVREKVGVRKKEEISFFSLSHPKEKERVQYGIKGVCGSVYRRLGFGEIIRGTRRDHQWNEILESCVLCRVADPDSKKKTVETLAEDYNEEISLEKMYRMMDKLHPHISRVKKLVVQNTLSLFNQQVDILFFDVTTLYFESFFEDDLRRCGYSKDNKIKETQVVLGLVTNYEGHPLSYELFPGNTSEGCTLINAVEKLKKDFKVNKVVLVADRAMFGDRNLDYMETQGIKYVVAAKLKSFSREKKSQILEEKNYKPAVVVNELQWTKELEYKNRRIIVSYSSKRAKKNQKERQKLIDRLMKKAQNKQIPLKNLIPNYGTKKYITVQNTQAKINETKIQEDQKWDGLHGVITNIKHQPAPEILNRYRGLWKIEEAFRSCKHTLKMRPIYHWKKRRIQSHIAICFLAYCLSYTMKHQMEQKGLKLSIKKMRDILKKDQYSIIEDQKTKKLYKLPSKLTPHIQNIYSAFQIKRISHITPLNPNH